MDSRENLVLDMISVARSSLSTKHFVSGSNINNFYVLVYDESFNDKKIDTDPEIKYSKKGKISFLS
jgi:hypothetical protein